MISRLSIHNVGPAEEVCMEFGQGLNVITGDNGVGKSFLLDVIWWTLTRQWPQEVNPTLTCGRKAMPTAGAKASIHATLTGQTTKPELNSTYDRKTLEWSLPKGRPTKQGLVVYAMVDGSFSVWDPARNYWRRQEQNQGDAVKQAAYVFSPWEVWNGQDNELGERTCNGLISDWRDWILENDKSMEYLQKALAELSPKGEKIQVRGLTRVGSDTRRIPTLCMPYTQKEDAGVPIVHASSGIKRVATLAYLLVWAWQEHLEACKRTGEKVTSGITLLIDEVEAHLHPRWQRTILRAFHSVIANMTAGQNVLRHIQMIVTTHSPLVMASCEDFFDPENDKWFDLDICAGNVKLTERAFEKHGDVSDWLVSDAFDMPSTCSEGVEQTLCRACDLMKRSDASLEEARSMQHELARVLSARDDFWFQWRFFIAKLQHTQE